MYNWILIKKADSSYLGWSNYGDEPVNNDIDNIKWVKWGKALPDVISCLSHKLVKGELVKI